MNVPCANQNGSRHCSQINQRGLPASLEISSIQNKKIQQSFFWKKSGEIFFLFSSPFERNVISERCLNLNTVDYSGVGFNLTSAILKKAQMQSLLTYASNRSILTGLQSLSAYPLISNSSKAMQRMIFCPFQTTI